MLITLTLTLGYVSVVNIAFLWFLRFSIRRRENSVYKLQFFYIYQVINCHSSNTSREQNHQQCHNHDFAGKGMLNVLGGVPPK